MTGARSQIGMQAVMTGAVRDAAMMAGIATGIGTVQTDAQVAAAMAAEAAPRHASVPTTGTVAGIPATGPSAAEMVRAQIAPAHPAQAVALFPQIRAAAMAGGTGQAARLAQRPERLRRARVVIVMEQGVNAAGIAAVSVPAQVQRQRRRKQFLHRLASVPRLPPPAAGPLATVRTGTVCAVMVAGGAGIVFLVHLPAAARPPRPARLAVAATRAGARLHRPRLLPKRVLHLHQRLCHGLRRRRGLKLAEAGAGKVAAAGVAGVRAVLRTDR